MKNNTLLFPSSLLFISFVYFFPDLFGFLVEHQRDAMCGKDSFPLRAAAERLELFVQTRLFTLMKLTGRSFPKK